MYFTKINIVLYQQKHAAKKIKKKKKRIKSLWTATSITKCFKCLSDIFV